MKDVRQSKVGDTVTNASKPAAEALGGYSDPKPMVFSGLYPIDGTDYPVLRDALDKLKLNDAALNYEPETSVALGFGFRVGFLGLLHLEIVRERLEREFDLDLISTAPNVVYEVTLEDKSVVTVTNPSEFPSGKIGDVNEPMVKAHDPGAVASSSARSWSSARPSAASCRAWTTCPRSASSCATCCRWRRSSSTSSTS